MQGQHFSVANLQLLHRLSVIVEKLAVVIQVLGCSRDSVFRLHGFLQQADCGVRGNLEREEVGVIVGGGGDGQGDAPVRSVSRYTGGEVGIRTDILAAFAGIERIFQESGVWRGGGGENGDDEMRVSGWGIRERRGCAQ